MNLLKYTLLRLALVFSISLICVWALKIAVLLSIIFALLMSLSLSYLFFPKLREAAGVEVAQLWRKLFPTKNIKHEDTLVEDEYVEKMKKSQGLDF
ncbi:DUF4229 domain-containing protein [Rothia sp. P13129]|uniref:DUF4229 domain-containing protein n=1 Tax=unclassified Rothia (in: high G+C Gram-positive bacteria) TaxID=2689056 RepID=UPI003AD22920